MVLLLIKCVIASEILSWSDAVDFHVKSLRMQYSVITASDGCSTDIINVIAIKPVTPNVKYMLHLVYNTTCYT